MIETDPHPASLLTTAAAANLLGVSTRTIVRWIQDGDLPAVRVGLRGYRIAPDALSSLVVPA